jgi:protein disulfide-isomerase
MQLYHDGARQVTFEGVREYERIIHFIEEHTGVSKPSVGAASPELPESDLKTTHNEPNPHGEVLALTSETFAGVVAGGDVFVKFFAPWWVSRLLREAPNERTLTGLHVPTGVDIAKN